MPGTHLEGFTYLGLGNISLLVLSLIILIKNKIFNTVLIYDFKVLRILNICFIVFIFWAISTNVSILGNKILSLDIPKYLLAVLSIFSSTGRFSWPVIYFILFICLLLIFKSFSKRNKIFVVSALLIIQISDISLRILENKLKDKIGTLETKDQIWDVIDENFDEVRTTYLFNNYGPLFTAFSKILGSLNNVKTDIILNAALDRKKAAEIRYELVDNINDGRIPLKRAYLVDNLGHLKQLKKQFFNKDYGFFYRDNFWIILPDKKN